MAQPRIAAYASLADGNATPTRIIEGQNTLLNRTVHAIAYDDIHDEIVVQSNIGQAILTYRGGATGDEAPIRIIQGPKTQLRDPQTIFIDPVNDEIYAMNMSVDDTMLVFDRLAEGDVAPKRMLKTPAAVAGVGAVDAQRDLLVLGGRGADGIWIYDRTAEGDVPPLRKIEGPNSGLGGAGRIVVYPPTGKIVATVGNAVAVWNIDDDGDVPPEWRVGEDFFEQTRGLTLDPKNKTIVVGDKLLNAIVTLSLPEMF